MTWDKAHHYPESVEYEDISIAVNEVDSWIDMLNAHDLSKKTKVTNNSKFRYSNDVDSAVKSP